MATHPRLVNKQFNSPIGLYSAQNVQEVLEREAQILANGAIGINFHNPDVGKPANLKNSAVLRMLEEEENRQRNGIGPGSKRVAWPPPNESGLDSPYVEQNSVSSQGGPQYPSQSPGFQQNNYQAPAQQQPVSYNPPSHRPLKPLDVSTSGSSPLSSPLVNQSPQGFRPATPSRGWAPVHSPVTTPTQPSWQQHSPSVAALSQPSWQQAAPSAAAPSQPSWRQPASQPPQQQIAQPPQQQITQPPQQQTTSTHFQAAHQSVSQHTYLGQQYAPTSFHPPQQQYQPPQQQNQAHPQQYQTPSQQYQAPPQQYQPPQQQYQPPQQQYQPPQQQYQPPQQQYQPPQQQYQPPQQQYQPPQQQYQPPQQQYQPAQQQYQPPQQQYQPPQQQYQPPQQQYQVPPQQYQASSQQYQVPSQQNQAPPSSPKPAAAPSQVAPRVQSAPASKPVVEPPPSTITLRQNAPVSQAPPPVVTSQPATATLKGGKHLRGDLKWPPENVRIQVAEENRLLLELAQGPACKPKRPNKDYTEFFEQHALNSTYPGYKIPPGTQFYRPV